MPMGLRKIGARNQKKNYRGTPDLTDRLDKCFQARRTDVFKYRKYNSKEQNEIKRKLSR